MEKQHAYITATYPAKIGFHCGPGGNRTGIGAHFATLAKGGRRPVVKSVDDYGVLSEALAADPQAVTIFRLTGGQLELPYQRQAIPAGTNGAADRTAAGGAARARQQPDYALDPLTTAKDHWARIQAALPPEFDKRTWLELMNEPDKNRSEWLAEFSFHLAHLMLAQDYRLATFSWSTGEPEQSHWSGPKMVNFLTLAAANPDKIAIALHEYSLSAANIRHGYPSHIGRFMALVNLCEALKINCPTILVTEFGWSYNQIPSAGTAIEHLKWAIQLYGSYPQIAGAAIWYLGGGFGEIADQVQPLIVPLTKLILSLPPISEPVPPPKPPPVHLELFRVTCRALNVRDAPTTRSNVIGQLPRNALIAAIGRHGDADLKAVWRQFGENVWSAEIYRGVSYMVNHR